MLNYLLIREIKQEKDKSKLLNWSQNISNVAIYRLDMSSTNIRGDI